MNKILIKDLLNDHKEKNEITKINDELFQLCAVLPHYASSLPKELVESFASVLAKLLNLKSGSSNEEDSTTGITTAYQISTIMEEILKHFPNKVNDPKKEEKEASINGKSVIFNIMTTDMMNKNKTSLQSYRGHRFSDDNIIMLEQWYSEHYQKPYLTKSSLEKLSKITGLSKIQIRNWVSNRRRKEKTVHISPAILTLVQNK